MRFLPVLCVVLLPAVATVVRADSPSAASTGASSLSVDGSATVLAGSVQLAAGAGDLVVTSVQSVGDTVQVVLEGASAGARVSLTVGLQAAGALSLAAGDVLRLVATASGHLLVRGGEVLAFVPAGIGTALFHHQRVGR